MSSKESGSGIRLFSTRKLTQEMGAKPRLENGPDVASAYLQLL